MKIKKQLMPLLNQLNTQLNNMVLDNKTIDDSVIKAIEEQKHSLSL